jgi:hypothetical protein
VSALFRHVRYLSLTPTRLRKDGLVVVHNHVRPTDDAEEMCDWPLGLHGFRAWLASPDPTRAAAYARGQPGYEVEPCSCPWAPELGATTE